MIHDHHLQLAKPGDHCDICSMAIDTAKDIDELRKRMANLEKLLTQIARKKK